MQVGPHTYNQMGDAYARTNENGVYNALHERPSTLALLPDVKGKRVLDLGCGPGVYSAILADLGAEVTAVDGSEKMVALSSQRLQGRGKVLLANFDEPLDFLGPASFDVVLSTLAIHYIADLPRLARQMHQLLKPGGQLVLSTEHPGLSYDNAPSDNYFLCQPRIETWTLEGAEYRIAIYRRPLSQMVQPFIEAGFQLECISEGVLTDELREKHPDFYSLFLRQPPFIFFRWKKAEHS